MAKYKKVVTKTVDEWLALRQPRIGGSEISAILGINPWESKYELYLRKKGQIEPKVENMAMKLGHKIENAVAELLQEEAGYQIIKNTGGNLIYLSEDYPFAEASPDRIAYLPGAKHSNDNKCIVEIKTTQKTVDPEEIPAHWVCQVMWYMGITGIHNAVIAWLTQGRDFGYQTIDFDEDFFNDLAEEAAAFKDDLDNDREPAPVSAADVVRRYPRHEDGKDNEVGEQVALACEKYKQIKAEIKARETELDECENIIKLAIADAESISYGGLRLATFKAAKDSEKFDAKTFAAENPDVAARYTKTVPGARRLVVK